GRYANTHDLLKLGWLPMSESREFRLTKLAFKSIYSVHCPEHLQLERYIPARTLRSSSEFQLNTNYVEGTFKQSACKAFNGLPRTIRESSDLHEFNRLLKAHYKKKGADNLL
ncbi:hypothetical protein ACROYT_G028437, partial [Oculina patagonica]